MCQEYFLSLILSEQDNTSASLLHKRTRLVVYKNPMNPLIKEFKIFYLHIYFQSFFLLKNTYLNIEEFQNSSKKSFVGTEYQLSWLIKINQIIKIKKSINYLIHKTFLELLGIFKISSKDIIV
jgi:hypothetical protein